MRFDQQRAVVTGGGRGIGAAVARGLAAAGAAVVVAARSRDEIGETAARLRAAGHRAWSVAADVSDPEQVAALHRQAEEKLGGVDVLVNNAGITSSEPFRDVRLEDWNRLFAVNVTGTMLCTQAFLPGMLERGWGRVVNIASVAGTTGSAYLSAYSAAKHAVVGLTRSVALEVATRGVTINAVCPAYVETDMTAYAVERFTKLLGSSPEETREMILNKSPQRRIFNPEEVAYLVLTLCDPRAYGVNGQAIVLDGGALQA
ncbi:MAG TPA: SDR family NAD(P)-dependent oxidoreductase [Thermoanaerobaculia bacterium]|jgi:3-hydroxybutyrate dehydrogenase